MRCGCIPENIDLAAFIAYPVPKDLYEPLPEGISRTKRTCMILRNSAHL
jgi:hypothetical protein